MNLQFLLTTRSPIHIGNGEILNPLDYFYDPKTKKVNIISFEKVLTALGTHIKKEVVTNYINDLVNYVENSVNNTQLNFSIADFLQELDINPEVTVEHSLKSVSLGNHKTQINKFLRTSYGYYIPGSSLKGTLRTAFLYNQMKETKTTIDDNYKLVKNKKWAAHNLEKRIFGNSPFEDLFKVISISDSIPIKDRFINISKIEKRDIVTNNPILELYVQTCFLKENKNENNEFLSFRVNYDQKKHFYLKGKKYGENLIDLITNAANAFSTAIIEHEIKTIKNKTVNDFYKHMFNDIKLFKEKNKFIIPLGYGTGFLSKTITLLLDPSQLKRIRAKYKIGKKNSPIFPLQRTFITDLTDGNTSNLPLPIGWVEITIEKG